MKQKGSVLVETLIALGAAVVIIAAITGMVISALNNAESARSQDLAGQYAQEGMEVMRNMARSNWQKFQSYNGQNCLAQGSSDPVPLLGANGCDPNIGVFKREIDVDTAVNQADCLDSSKVTIIVSWTDTKCSRANAYCHNVELQSCISDIGVVPSP